MTSSKNVENDCSKTELSTNATEPVDNPYYHPYLPGIVISWEESGTVSNDGFEIGEQFMTLLQNATYNLMILRTEK